MLNPIMTVLATDHHLLIVREFGDITLIPGSLVAVDALEEPGMETAREPEFALSDASEAEGEDLISLKVRLPNTTHLPQLPPLQGDCLCLEGGGLPFRERSGARFEGSSFHDLKMTTIEGKGAEFFEPPNFNLPLMKRTSAFP